MEASTASVRYNGEMADYLVPDIGVAVFGLGLVLVILGIRTACRAIVESDLPSWGSSFFLDEMDK